MLLYHNRLTDSIYLNELQVRVTKTAHHFTSINPIRNLVEKQRVDRYHTEEKKMNDNQVNPNPNPIEDPTSVSSESTFFVEYEEVNTLVSCLTATSTCTTNAHTSTSTTKHNNINTNAEHENKNDEDEIESNNEFETKSDEALKRLRVVFDKYLECSTLLDPYLEQIVTKLSRHAVDLAHTIYNNSGNDNNDDDKDDGDGKDGDGKDGDEEEKYIKIIRNLKRSLSAIYSISKVRGTKHIQKFLTHDVSDVEPVLYALRIMEEESKSGMSTSTSTNEELGIRNNVAFHTWESVRVLLVWIGMLSLVPFDLNTIDSSLKLNTSAKENIVMNEYEHDNEHENENDQKHEEENDEDKKEVQMTLIESMLFTTRAHLSDPGTTREAAARSLSMLLSRPDLETTHLQQFVQYSNTILEQYMNSNDPSGGKGIFIVMGVVQTLSAIFKTGSRSNLMTQHLNCVELLWEQAILVAERAAAKEGSRGGALLLRKLLVKLFARVGCSYLPPRVAEWRYQRGRRSLLENLSSAGVDTCVDTSNVDTSKTAATNINSNSNSNTDAEEKTANDENSDIFRVPDQVEDSMAQLIQALTDPATTVRWSAAKGIGRVTERLPAVCADDVLDAILYLCEDHENDNAWHGACLTLAELARRGLLLPRRLGEVVPIVVEAIQFDVPRGQHSVGSHVRDAACYTCWAFARAFAPDILSPYVPVLSKAIVIGCLFDREINCRRASSAAFQECVGRQGADNFKHGIEILTAADYFTLGNRKDAFTSVAFYVAGFEEYRRAIVDHLYEDKLFHWDPEIRYLASISLKGLTELDPGYFAETVLPYLLKYTTHENIFVRHGALIGVAEVVLALGDLVKDKEGEKLVIEDSILETLSTLVSVIEKARLYRGRGGEIMRAAVSRFIECMATSAIPLTVKQQVSILDTLDANLKHPNEDIQKAAADALYAVTQSYFPVGENGPSDRLRKRIVDMYINTVNTDDNPAATRGYSLALGHLPSKLLAPNADTLNSVIDCLCRSSDPNTRVGGEGDAETRKNSIDSLFRVCETVGIGVSPDAHCIHPTVALGSTQVNRVFEALLNAMNDYNTDRRGDVGSWSRIAAMISLEKLVYLAVKASDIPQQTPPTSVSTESSVVNLTVPALFDRFNSLETDVSMKARNCFVENKPYRDYQAIEKSVYFGDEICSKVVGSMLKQLSEKLDAVRNQAGICLQRLLLNNHPTIPFVSHRKLLVEALLLHKDDQINWATPEITFPLVMRAINIDTFFDCILSGIIISVGGLTESVQKSSSKAFMEYIRGLKSLKTVGKLAKIGHGECRPFHMILFCFYDSIACSSFVILLSGLIRIFDKYTKDGRVILPLLVSVDKVLSYGGFDGLLHKEDNNFAKDLGVRIRREASRCTDIKRLMAVVPVAINILHCSDNEVRKTMLLFLMRVLAHKYPRIRRHTAEQLYVKLIEDESVVSEAIDLEGATDLLSNTQWDRDLGPPGNIRVTRNKVAELLGVSLTEKDIAGPKMKKVVKNTDEFASYASLVQTAGF